MPHPRTLATLAVTALLLLAGRVGLHLLIGLRVRIENMGATTLRSVVVHVTGKSYPTGDLKPGLFMSLQVEPTGESAVEIAFQDEAGRLKRLSVDCYFEPGYLGTVRVEMDSDRILRSSGPSGRFLGEQPREEAFILVGRVP